MAKPRNPSPLFALLLFFFFFFFFFFSVSTAVYSTTQQSMEAGGILIGRRSGGILVGGRTKVEDVKTNKEVQELGRYCVEQYNRYRSRNGSGGSSSKPAVVFVEVVEAERQVVSGIKYYLKISAVAAAGSSGVPRTFNAVVVVKPWAHSKDMLSFSPSPSLPSTK